MERKEIKELLTVHEYANAKESTLTSFYTPLSVIDNIYRILERMGFNQGRVIETSMGNGNFFGRMPNDMYSNSTLCGVELDSMSATISGYLYDKVEVENTGFESNSYPNNYFDLAISNVPFGFTGCTLIGDITANGPVTVSEDSKVTGNITAQSLLCAGEINGDIRISGNTQMDANARVSGSVVTGTISVAAGAVLNGSVEMKGTMEAKS